VLQGGTQQSTNTGIAPQVTFGSWQKVMVVYCRVYDERHCRLSASALETRD